MRHVQFMQKLCRGIALVGQLGFSLITPPVALLWLAHWSARHKYQLGVWVTIVALILGLAHVGEHGFAILPQAVLRKRKTTRPSPRAATAIISESPRGNANGSPQGRLEGDGVISPSAF